MKERIIGAIAVVFSCIGAFYSAYAGAHALLTGISPGRLGASHHVGTVQYAGFVFGCLIALALMGMLGAMGVRWVLAEEKT